MKRHSLRTLFASLLRPFLDAWRDEFSPRPAKLTPAPDVRHDQNADSGTSYDAKAPESLSYGVADQPRPAPAVVPASQAPARPWREAMAQRLAAEPAGLRPKPPAKRTRAAANRSPRTTGAPRSPRARSRRTA